MIFFPFLCFGLSSLDSVQMRIKAMISFLDQLTVKAPFTPARLIAANQ